MSVERALAFDCAGDTLVGVVTLPRGASRVGMVILPGGPNYRVGAHRQFVHLARSVAAAGAAVLRFDYRGVGDSSGTPAGFERVHDDVRAAIDALVAAAPGVEDVVLCGLCEGASSALLYVQRARDRRVAGLVLANPWVRSPATLARTYLRHYYAQRLMSRAFWTKLLRGRLDVRGSGRALAAHARSAIDGRDDDGVSFPQAMAAALAAFRGGVLLALSEGDLTAREFVDHAERDPHWRGLLARGNVLRRDFAGADHTFSGASARAALEACVTAWLLQTTAVARAAATGRARDEYPTGA